jgi:hypothetical protein
VSLLMRLFVTALEREVSKMHANNIRLKVVGDLSRFDAKLQDMIASAERKTANNTRMTVTVCANYGGRWDIMQAVAKWWPPIPAPPISPKSMLAPHLAMAYAPEPDLFIRTGGEQRISNFLLWQLAYTELFFTDTYWPDFSIESSTRRSPPTSTASAVLAAPARNWPRRQANAENEDYHRSSCWQCCCRSCFQLFPGVCFGRHGVFGAAMWEGARLFGLGEAPARVIGVVGAGLFVLLMYSAKPGAVRAVRRWPACCG